MNRYNNLSDDFYVNLNLNTEMELPSARESVLYFFERLQKRYPTMRNFYSRERREFILEEDKGGGRYRWASIEPQRICAGYVNPESLDEVTKLHGEVMELAPYTLAVSSIDCESLNVMFGFDFTYRGNHNQLVAEALGVAPAFDRMLEIAGANVVSYEPSIQFALDDDCKIQCRLSIENRTSPYYLRIGDYPEEQLSVYVTARRYGGLDPGESYVDAVSRLFKLCREIVDDYVTDQILRPLQQTISRK
jgi:hypothetical protein